MIQTKDDFENNGKVLDALGMVPGDGIQKLYDQLGIVWKTLDLPSSFEEAVNASVRTALAMHLVDGMPLAAVIHGMSSHLIMVGYNLHRCETLQPEATENIN